MPAHKKTKQDKKIRRMVMVPGWIDDWLRMQHDYHNNPAGVLIEHALVKQHQLRKPKL